MTEENHCYENAMAERVNGILKDEYLLDRTFKDIHMHKRHAGGRLCCAIPTVLIGL